MAGRNHMPHHPEGPRSVLIRPAALEEELEMQQREIQRIIAENRLVIDDNTLLQMELSAAKDEIHRLGKVIPTLRAEKEARVRDLVQRGLKLEADFRATEPLRAEVVQLRDEVQKLNTLRQELSSQVQGLTKYTNRLKAEHRQLVYLRTDVDGLRKELVEARRVYKYEKKANEEQVEQKQAMETNLVFMAREAEKLRAQRIIAEDRTRGLGFDGYEMSNGGPEMRYQVEAFADSYASAWGYSDKRGPN